MTNAGESATNETAADVDTTTTTVDTTMVKVKAPKEGAAAKPKEESEEEKEFDDWENAIEDVAESLAGKAKRQNLPIAMGEGDEFSSDSEEQKVEEVKTGPARSTAQAKKRGQEDAAQTSSAFDNVQTSDGDAAARRQR